MGVGISKGLYIPATTLVTSSYVRTIPQRTVSRRVPQKTIKMPGQSQTLQGLSSDLSRARTLGFPTPHSMVSTKNAG